MKNKIYQEIQNRLDTNKKVTIIVGTGASISVDRDFGMDALEVHLKGIIQGLIDKQPELQLEWESVLKKRNEGVDFENSLNELKSDGELLEIVIRETANFVAKINRKYLPALQRREIHIPISTLFSKLKGKLSNENPTINIITPNYDLLLEYALIKEQINFSDGFYGNLQKEYDWKEVEFDFLRYENYKPRNSKTPKTRQITTPHFKLHKIHGSLNYFVIRDKIIRDDTLTFNDDINVDRFIITPGATKYKRQIKNLEFLTPCDNVIQEADCFLFVGYGFNDIEIDFKIRKALNNGKNAIIVTKKMLGGGPDLISKHPKIIAIEAAATGKGSTIRHEGQVHNFNESLWEIDTFAREIL
jgi:hypothetical protein